MKAGKTKKTSRKSIPDEIKRQVDQIVDDFNRATLRGDPNYYFVARYKGDCVYLDRFDYGKFGPICLIAALLNLLVAIPFSPLSIRYGARATSLNLSLEFIIKAYVI